MKISEREEPVLIEQYQKIGEQLEEQGFVSQLCAADIIRRLVNMYGTYHHMTNKHWKGEIRP